MRVEEGSGRAVTVSGRDDLPVRTAPCRASIWPKRSTASAIAPIGHKHINLRGIPDLRPLAAWAEPARASCGKCGFRVEGPTRSKAGAVFEVLAAHF